MRNIPKVICMYPIFWATSLVPIYWVLFLCVLFFERKELNSRYSTKFIKVVLLLTVASIPIGITIENNFPANRIFSSLGNALIWLSFILFIQKLNDNSSRKLTNSLLFLVLAQGFFTLLAILVPAVRGILPLKVINIFGDTGYGFSGKYLFYTDWLETTVQRSAGISGNPTWAGAVALGGFVIAGLVLNHKTEGSRHLALLTLPLSIVNIYLAQSRSLLIGLGIAGSIALFVYISGQDHLNRAFAGIVVICSSVTIGILTFSTIYQFVNYVDSARIGSRFARIDIYTATIEKIREIPIPILGYGFKPDSEGLVAAIGSHSTYLGLFFRGGILSALAYIAFLAIFAKLAWKARSSIAVFSIVFLTLWSIFEDVDAGHFVLFYFFYIYHLGINQKTKLSK
jgi:hypothetical protein